MKNRKLLIGALLAFSLSSVQAQIANELGVGVKAGYNFNQFNQPGTSAGFQAGGFARFAPVSFLTVQGELLYDMQGGGRQSYARFVNGDPINTIIYSGRSVQIQTVSIPLSVRYAPVSNSSVVLNIIAGGSFEYLFGVEEQFDAQYVDQNGNSVLFSNVSEDVSGDLSSTQISVHIGAAFDFVMEDGRAFTYEMRYRRGLSNLNETVTDLAELTESLNTSSFTLSIYYPLF